MEIMSSCIFYTWHIIFPSAALATAAPLRMRWPCCEFETELLATLGRDLTRIGEFSRAQSADGTEYPKTTIRVSSRPTGGTVNGKTGDPSTERAVTLLPHRKLFTSGRISSAGRRLVDQITRLRSTGDVE
ncbi:Hypothetical protein NTJ_14561 [Nesidiocoris tenuis]|uniref:Secreted protein n=1 Tax=Nesidiocoris tenuis TaxID=355587 RepID=A0ABN7BDJ8_9HEMI|nr:Hypothetical protein NTJ_14561 [Nesidiocoris tenuis]